MSKSNDILKPEIVVFAIKLYRKFCMVFVGWSIEKNSYFSAIRMHNGIQRETYAFVHRFLCNFLYKVYFLQHTIHGRSNIYE